MLGYNLPGLTAFHVADLFPVRKIDHRTDRSSMIRYSSPPFPKEDRSGSPGNVAVDRFLLPPKGSDKTWPGLPKGYGDTQPQRTNFTFNTTISEIAQQRNDFHSQVVSPHFYGLNHDAVKTPHKREQCSRVRAGRFRREGSSGQERLYR